MPPPAEPRLVAEVTAFGVTVAIQIGGSRAAELLDHVLDVWEWCGATEVEASGGIRVETSLAGGDSLQAVSERLTSAVTFAAIDASKGDRLMLHAAGLADPDTGRTVVLVGPSGAGKSTASRTLNRHFGYVTDETVALTRELELLAYPKPVSLFVDETKSGKAQHSPSSLGLQRAPEALRPAAVLLLDRHSEGFVPPVLTDVSTAEAIAMLGEQTSFLGSLDRPLHRLADLLHAVGGAQRVAYSEADDLIAVVKELLTDDSHTNGRRVDSPQPTLAEAYAAASRPSPGDQLIARRELTDVHTEDGVACVMVDGNVVALSPMASRIVTLLGSEPASIACLVGALVAEFGAPESGDPAELVEALVTDLVDAGVVERVVA